MTDTQNKTVSKAANHANALHSIVLKLGDIDQKVDHIIEALHQFRVRAYEVIVPEISDDCNEENLGD